MNKYSLWDLSIAVFVTLPLTQFNKHTFPIIRASGHLQKIKYFNLLKVIFTTICSCQKRH